MQAHYLQHVPFEGLGSIAGWLQNAGYRISCTKLYALEQFPRLEYIDFLIVLGGPMSVNDEIEFPWLIEEKKFIQAAIAAGKPVLGICLGAQLLANVMGCRVFPNPVKEIGWFPLHAVPSADDTFFQFPETCKVFHWHGETFDLPQGAARLAESSCCANQAFQLGRNVIGLQFHLETTPVLAEALVENCADELVAGAYIQSKHEILSALEKDYASINRLMARLLAYLLAENG